MSNLIAPDFASRNPTDFSGTTDAGSKVAAAAQTNRGWLFLQNISDTVMYAKFGSAAAASAGSILIPANGGTLRSEQLELTPTTSVNLYCASAGKEYTLLIKAK